jgi:hypothetical protein
MAINLKDYKKSIYKAETKVFKSQVIKLNFLNNTAKYLKNFTRP